MKYMKKLYYLFLLSGSLFAQTLFGQTYYHDPSVMNQFTVTEIGLGSLMPDTYYAAFHNRYRQEAYETGKQVFRTQVLLLLNQEVPYSETIDSIHLYRAEIEGLNMAERTPNMLDAAWVVEKEKIEKAQELFRSNIEMITRLGGTPTSRSEWQDISKSIDCGLQAVREAYMPLSQRKRQYLAIYQDLVRYNTQLCQYLYQLRNCRHIYAPAVKPNSVCVGDVAGEAHDRWMSAISASLHQ